MQTNFSDIKDSEIEKELIQLPDNYDEINRRDKIMKISQEVYQINDLMKDLTKLVEHQAHDLKEIQENVDQTKELVVITNNNLIQTAIYQNRYYHLMMYSGITLMTVCCPILVGVKGSVLILSSGLGLWGGYNYVKKKII